MCKVQRSIGGARPKMCACADVHPARKTEECEEFGVPFAGAGRPADEAGAQKRALCHWNRP